ncbi:hypothetical protein [Sorangium sp. So ce341]|uniref:hypothetical protein n=1 Tax=Sorangium sp. So ce341 TaxID=3133302 RepID=UPI003F5EE8DB
MTLTIDVNTNDVIDLPECIRLLSGIKGISRRERMDDAACYLRMLSNNKSFLIEHVNRQICEAQPLDAYQLSSNFSQQIVDLGGGPGFRLRANMWPRCAADAPADWERSLFAYLMPHDHNADFLTVGYWGPGYETDIYEYDPERTVGFEGEQVDIQFLERTRLTNGKVMFYRANRDIHTQLPPDDFSISINLLVADPEAVQSTKQYWFDVERGVISSSVERLDYSPFVFLCRLASMVGDGATINVLEKLAQGHSDARIRAEAFTALATLDPGNASRHWRDASEDVDPYVQRVARAKLSAE